MDGKESNIQFYWMMKSYIGRGVAESNITFQNPIKLYIGRLDIQYSLYLSLKLIISSKFRSAQLFISSRIVVIFLLPSSSKLRSAQQCPLTIRFNCDVNNPKSVYSLQIYSYIWIAFSALIGRYASSDKYNILCITNKCM